jgi:hypothetical protein
VKGLAHWMCCRLLRVVGLAHARHYAMCQTDFATDTPRCYRTAMDVSTGVQDR